MRACQPTSTTILESQAVHRTPPLVNPRYAIFMVYSRHEFRGAEPADMLALSDAKDIQATGEGVHVHSGVTHGSFLALFVDKLRPGPSDSWANTFTKPIACRLTCCFRLTA